VGGTPSSPAPPGIIHATFFDAFFLMKLFHVSQRVHDKNYDKPNPTRNANSVVPACCLSELFCFSFLESTLAVAFAGPSLSPSPVIPQANTT